MRGRLALVALLHTLVGWWLATRLPGPLLSADDITHLALARTLAGAGPQPLTAQPPYGIAYPLAVAPAWLVGAGPAGVLGWARAVSALAGGATVVVCHELGRRAFGLGPRRSLAAALVAASLPAGLVTASITWSERLGALTVSLLVLAAVVAVDRFPGDARSRPIGPGAGVVVAAAVTAGTHPRLVVVALVVVAFVAVAWRERPVAALVLAGTGLLAVAGVDVLGRLVQEAALGSGGTYGVADLAGRRGIGLVGAMGVRALGAWASFVAATAGFAVVGLAEAWRRPATRVLIPVVAVVAAEAGWFLVGIERADAWYHGRYLDVVAPVVVVAAAAALTHWSPGRTVLVVVSAALAGGVAAVLGSAGLWDRPRSPVMMLGVEVAGAPFGAARFSPALLTLVIVVVALAVVATRDRHRAVAGVLVATLVAGAVSGSVVIEHLWDAALGSRVHTAVREVQRVAPGSRLVVRPEGLAPGVAQAAAWENGLARTVIDTGTGTAERATGAPPAAAVVLSAPASVPGGAEVLASVDGSVFWRASPGQVGDDP